MSQGETQLDTADPLVGRVLSERYRVLRLIGEGGIGRVYLADHLGTGREVALKVLLPEFAGNLQLVDTFLELPSGIPSGLRHIIRLLRMFAYRNAVATPSELRRTSW